MKTKAVIFLIVTVLAASAIAQDTGWKAVTGATDLEYRWRPGLTFGPFQFRNLSPDKVAFTYVVLMQGADKACVSGGPIELRGGDAGEASPSPDVCMAIDGTRGNGKIDRVTVSVKSRK